MASRIMHLAIGKLLEEQIDLKDVERFRIGQILPDAIEHNTNVPYNSHFRRSFNNNTKCGMDFNAYYLEYEKEILEDSLYLGYYFHLIEDVIFRQFIYYHLGTISKRGTPELLNVLYNDYHILNEYLIQKHHLLPLKSPTNFENERINQICPFDLDSFLTEMQGDFSDHFSEEPKLFTKSYVDSYIEQCRAYCSREYFSLQKHTHAFYPIELLWDNV